MHRASDELASLGLETYSPEWSLRPISLSHWQRRLLGISRHALPSGACDRRAAPYRICTPGSSRDMLSRAELATSITCSGRDTHGGLETWSPASRLETCSPERSLRPTTSGDAPVEVTFVSRHALPSGACDLLDPPPLDPSTRASRDMLSRAELATRGRARHRAYRRSVSRHALPSGACDEKRGRVPKLGDLVSRHALPSGACDEREPRAGRRAKAVSRHALPSGACDTIACMRSNLEQQSRDMLSRAELATRWSRTFPRAPASGLETCSPERSLRLRSQICQRSLRRCLETCSPERSLRRLLLNYQ